MYQCAERSKSCIVPSMESTHLSGLGLCVSLIPKTVAAGDSASFFLLPSHMRCASLHLLSGIADVRVSKPQGLP